MGIMGPVEGGGMWGLGGMTRSGPSKLSSSYTSPSSWEGGGRAGAWCWGIGSWKPIAGGPPMDEGRGAPAMEYYRYFMTKVQDKLNI